MRFTVLFLVVFFAVSCGATSSSTKSANEGKAAVVKAPPPPPPPNLSTQGTPVALGSVVDVRGAGTVWLKGTRLLISLLTTKWQEVDVGSGPERDGRATFQVSLGDQLKSITVDEGDSQTVFGFKITLKYAYEVYVAPENKPHAKFVVTRAK